jgi:hypothetical protein
MPEAIFAEPEVLGRVDPVAIGGFTGTALTPGDNHLQSAREYWAMVEWEWADPTYLEQPSGCVIERASQGYINWGWISTKPENGVAVSTLLLALDYEEAMLDVDINGWLRTLSDWLQAYTLQVVAPQTASADLIGRSIRAWRVADGSPGKFRIYLEGRVSTFRRGLWSLLPYGRHPCVELQTEMSSRFIGSSWEMASWPCMQVIRVVQWWRPLRPSR